MNDTESLGEIQMLHPMTLVQRFLLSLPAFVLILLPLLRSPESADFVPVLILIIYGVLALPLIFLRYFRFRYHITRTEIVIQSGIFTRQNRSIPIERIQNIEIEQAILPRLFGTAKVKIETAGSAKTEGVLEFVSVRRAHQIRDVIRTYQQEQTEPAPEPGLSETTLSDPSVVVEEIEKEEEPLFQMSLQRVLLTGMLRFSLLYIAIAFSLVQQLNPDPDDIESWIRQGWLQPLAELGQHSPWLLTIGAILIAVSLSWITGILVSLNQNF